MGVKVISASINEKGTTTGGKPGNQGNEIKRRDYYVHSKGWYLLRPVDLEVAADIAYVACAVYHNKHYGYCQDHRLSGVTAAKPYGYDPAKVTEDCEIDCSELVRLACLYAGINVQDFNTATEKQVLLSTGKFTEIPLKGEAYLGCGDILVTKTKGHTEIVVE